MHTYMATSQRISITQLFDRRRQTRNLILLSADQGDQLVVFTGREVFVDTHSQSIKT